MFKLENNYYKDLINDYWSAIDLIYLKVKGIPPYSASKKYFDILKSFILKEKEVIDFELFEIKLTRQTKKSNLSVKTHKLMKLLDKKGKKLNFVRVVLKGDFGINYDFVDYKKEDYYVRTHYGRKNRYIGPRFEN